MENTFQFVTKYNKFLVQTAQKCKFNEEDIYIVMWNSVDNLGEEFIDSSVYKYEVIKKLIDNGTLIKQ